MNLDTLQSDLSAVIESLSISAKSVQSMTRQIETIRQTRTIEDEWVQTWGEVVNKTRAGKMLGVSAYTVNQLIAAGSIQTAPDGRVLVRSAASWATSPRGKRKRRIG